MISKTIIDNINKLDEFMNREKSYQGWLDSEAKEVAECADKTCETERMQ